MDTWTDYLNMLYNRSGRTVGDLTTSDLEVGGLNLSPVEILSRCIRRTTFVIFICVLKTCPLRRGTTRVAKKYSCGSKVGRHQFIREDNMPPYLGTTF